MSYGDSEAVFDQRATQMGMEASVLKAFKDKGFKTMALFAFSCNSSPGAISDKAFIDMIKDVLAREPTPLELSILRRLFNESYANVAADIKSSVEATEDTVSRKLAPADRAERLKSQQARLKGLQIRGHYEPADALVDRCCSCYESDRLVYIEWSSCISRDFELMHNAKKDNNVTFGSDGTLKLAKSEKHEPAQTQSGIQVRYCLVRRALALDQANILSYEKHDAWTELLMDVRMSDPPPGFQRVTMQQVQQADKKLFSLMAEETRTGIEASISGRPCDLIFEKCYNATEVRHLLRPRMGHSSPVGTPSPSKPTNGENPNKRARPNPKGKGSGKNDNSQSFQRIPVELLKLGGVATTSQGHRLCFGYNLKSCNLQVKNQKCDRELHACCIKSCHKQHPAVDCANKKTE